MKKVFKKLNADAGKLNVNTIEDFYPIEGNSEVYVEVEHMKNGDMFNFLDKDSKEIDFAKMFTKKVKAVHGIEIEVADGTVIEATPKDIANISDPDFLAIVMNTCMFIIGGSELTEEESKN